MDNLPILSVPLARVSPWTAHRITEQAGSVDPVLVWFWRRLGVIFVRDLDPEVFLLGPSLAPLAVLGRGSSRVRTGALARALTMIRDEDGPRAQELGAFAIALAGITLDPATINRIVEEAEMTVDEYVAKTLWHGSYGEKLRQQLRERSLQEGAAEGRERLLVALMEDRFGPHPDTGAIAQHLIAQLDDAAAVHAVVTATDLADLVTFRLSSA